MTDLQPLTLGNSSSNSRTESSGNSSRSNSRTESSGNTKKDVESDEEGTWWRTEADLNTCL